MHATNRSPAQEPACSTCARKKKTQQEEKKTPSNKEPNRQKEAEAQRRRRERTHRERPRERGVQNRERERERERDLLSPPSSLPFLQAGRKREARLLREIGARRRTRHQRRIARYARTCTPVPGHAWAPEEGLRLQARNWTLRPAPPLAPPTPLLTPPPPASHMRNACVWASGTRRGTLDRNARRLGPFRQPHGWTCRGTSRR